MAWLVAVVACGGATASAPAPSAGSPSTDAPASASAGALSRAPAPAPASAPSNASTPAASPAPASVPVPTGGSVLVGEIVGPPPSIPRPPLDSAKPQLLSCYNEVRRTNAVPPRQAQVAHQRQRSRRSPPRRRGGRRLGRTIRRWSPALATPSRRSASRSRAGWRPSSRRLSFARDPFRDKSARGRVERLTLESPHVARSEAQEHAGPRRKGRGAPSTTRRTPSRASSSRASASRGSSTRARSSRTRRSPTTSTPSSPPTA